VQRVLPTLRVLDYARSRPFYRDGLGFAVEWEHRFEPGFPVFARISRDGMALFLSEHSGDCQVGGLVHFLVDDVDAYDAEFRGRGLSAHEAPDEGIEGLRMMTLLDPDGNQLRFFTRIDR
jgi:catechol 2,3-dioxygenase-like lactoylglutathione lyase family enzyme